MRVLGKQVVYDTSLLSFEPPNGPPVHPTPTALRLADWWVELVKQKHGRGMEGPFSMCIQITTLPQNAI